MTDRDDTHRDEPWVMYRILEWLCRTPETTITLCLHYNLIFKKGKRLEGIKKRQEDVKEGLGWGKSHQRYNGTSRVGKPLWARRWRYSWILGKVPQVTALLGYTVFHAVIGVTSVRLPETLGKQSQDDGVRETTNRSIHQVLSDMDAKTSMCTSRTVVCCCWFALFWTLRNLKLLVGVSKNQFY